MGIDSHPPLQVATNMSRHSESASSSRHKIWIDLDNTPHVPFFAPIIEELNHRGFSVLITARDCFQVCDLANHFGLLYKRIGHHHGKTQILKVGGLCVRALQLAPTVLREKPCLAISHGSRAQLMLSAILRLPSIVAADYEFAMGLVLLKPRWVMVPDAIPEDAFEFDKDHILKYPGIKEDVYVPRFKPDPGIQKELGIGPHHLVVTLRPPASEAHYHRPESDSLFEAVIQLLAQTPNTKVILLPRNQKQEVSIRKTWPQLFSSGKVVVPARALDGLNLIWHSDLVISGGGTMNREAAALGVPVYSIFRGKIGAIDRYLAQSGRLVLVESIGEVRTKILPQHRRRPATPASRDSGALRKIVDHITSVLESAQLRPTGRPRTDVESANCRRV
jgi:uncharacterized protein